MFASGIAKENSGTPAPGREYPSSSAFRLPAAFRSASASATSSSESEIAKVLHYKLRLCRMRPHQEFDVGAKAKSAMPSRVESANDNVLSSLGVE
jgi:hypothetical protein